MTIFSWLCAINGSQISLFTKNIVPPLTETERVDKLFFGLLVLVLGSVEDPLSTFEVVFNVPPGSQLHLLVEIPDRDAHLEPPPEDAALSAAELLAEEWSVIAAISTFC